jgi:hypothetical protein
MISTKEELTAEAETLLESIKRLEKYIYDDNYNNEHLRHALKTRLNLELAARRSLRIAILETIMAMN